MYGGPNPPLYKTFAPRFYKTFAPRFYNFLHDFTIFSTILQFPPRFYNFLHDFTISSTILQFPPRFYNFLHDFTKHLLHDFTISSTILQNISSTILQFPPRFYKTFPPRFYNFLHDFTKHLLHDFTISSTILQFPPRFYNFLHDFTIFSTILQFPPRFCNFLHYVTCKIVEEMFCKIVEQMFYKVAGLGHRTFGYCIVLYLDICWCVVYMTSRYTQSLPLKWPHNYDSYYVVVLVSEISCGTPPSAAQSTMTYTSTTYDSIVVCTCYGDLVHQDGYKTNTIICGGIGAWNNTELSCGGTVWYTRGVRPILAAVGMLSCLTPILLVWLNVWTTIFYP